MKLQRKRKILLREFTEGTVFECKGLALKSNKKETQIRIACSVNISLKLGHFSCCAHFIKVNLTPFF